MDFQSLVFGSLLELLRPRAARIIDGESDSEYRYAIKDNIDDAFRFALKGARSLGFAALSPHQRWMIQTDV